VFVGFVISGRLNVCAPDCTITDMRDNYLRDSGRHVIVQSLFIGLLMQTRCVIIHLPSNILSIVSGFLSFLRRKLQKGFLFYDVGIQDFLYR